MYTFTFSSLTLAVDKGGWSVTELLTHTGNPTR